jgi:azurin
MTYTGASDMMKLMCAIGLIFLARMAAADVCQLAVEATDQMRYEEQSLPIASDCSEVQVTLRNTGRLPANVMGHDWVLTKTSDVSAVANAGMSAGAANNYQKPGDPRIIASTKIIGGGESATVRFSLGLLDPQESYTYFCSAPGHAGIMKGRLVYKPGSGRSVAKNEIK